MSPRYPGRLALQQRVLPSYRVPFFDILAGACDRGLSVFAGQPRRSEAISTGLPRVASHAAAQNLHILGGSLYLCHQRGLTSWLEAWDPDALIMEANPRYLATGSGVRWMHARKRPVIGWGLGAPPMDGPFAEAPRARRRSFLQQFDALIAYSRRGAREYIEAGFPSTRVFTATNSVAPRPAGRPERLAHAGQPVVLYVGRLQPRKRVDLLIRACADMPEPKPRLIIVGDGLDRSHLEQLAQRVYAATEFVGAKHGLALAPYFEQADLFVLPGTGGLAIQEAMAHALPVIVAKGDGTQDDLVRDENGWQIPPGDYAALAGTMRSALADRARLRRMGDESYRIVSDEINLETMVGVFIQVLNGVTATTV